MANEILTRAIDAVASGSDLTADHASAVLEEIMEGRSDEVQTAAFLIALRTKGETVPELVGLARTMRNKATRVETARSDLVDTAGTGGGPSTFNVSTVAALVAAGAGCAVAKHGNRSNTSRCGSADLLEALGVPIDRPPEETGRQIEEIGFGFMFAPVHHS
jgi:anthranilate phosphoribosyltransferase